MVDKERVHATVSGRVQGVSFRDSTRQEAEKLGLTGWVRNTEDGNVEAIFEGDPDVVSRMVEWCKSGPSSADVEDVSIEKETPSGDPPSFEVR